MREADYAELSAHGYEVETSVIVDYHGVPWEPIYEVATPSYSSYALLTPDSRHHLIFTPCIGHRTRQINSSQEKFARNRTSLGFSNFSTLCSPGSSHVISLPRFVPREVQDVGHSTQNGECGRFCRVLLLNGLEPRSFKSARGLIDGLAYLHRLCIADRDIKPHNFLVDRDFCLKIIDFDYCYASKGRGRGGR